MMKDNPDLAKLKELCPIMVVQVWGSDECILRKAEYYRDSDIETVIARMLELAEENERLRKKVRKLRREVKELILFRESCVG
jgi:hypothetical protein